MSRLARKHFWVWFKRHCGEYRTFQGKSKSEITYLGNELKSHLRAYARCLDFTLSQIEKGECQLVITVRGRARWFKTVKDMVAKAPKIRGWSIVALEPRRPIDCMLEDEIAMAGAEPDELFFAFRHNDLYSRILNIYHPLCTNENRFRFTLLALGAMYNVLGEYVYGVEDLDVEPFNKSMSGDDILYPMSQLPVLIGMRKSDQMRIDDRGNLRGLGE